VTSNLTVKIGADIDGLRRELTKANAHLNSFGKGINSVTSQLKGLAAGFGLMEVGRQVIEVTSQFQKFEAILTNTLGSNSQAQKALREIRDFALTTPFEVSEVTAAYVRWANQGLSPTIDRMKKLGDVASSLGAGFEQTAEAFKDLMVGQTKRIEEVGISAQQANGKIQLSFKGVNIEIEKNAEGVQKALDVYSQLNGVLGTSDAVSQTLGGRISNLKDAWDGLMLSIGNSTSGPLFSVISALTTITNALANLGAELALIGQALSPFHDLRDVSKDTLDYLLKFARTDSGNKVADVLKPLFDQDDATFIKNYDDNHRRFINTLLLEGESMADINVLWAHYAQKRIDAARSAQEDAKQSRLNAVLKEKELALERLKAAQLERQKNAKKNVAIGDGGFAHRQSSGIPDLSTSINTSALENLAVKLEDISARIAATSRDVGRNIQSIPQAVLDAAPILNAGLEDMAAGLGEGIGNILAGAGTISDLGPILLGTLGGVMVQLGQMAISAGIGIEGIKKALMSMNGVVAIAAGIALVAIGTAVRAKASALGSGMGRGGSRGGGSSSIAGSPSSGFAKAMTEAQDSNPTLTAVVRNKDLWLILENYNKDSGFRKMSNG
jgi:hypothetical protein